MTSLDKIERASDRAARRRGRPGRHLAIELAETLKLAVPIALTQLGQIAMMTTDIALIGRLGDEAVAAAALAHTVLLRQLHLRHGAGLGGGAAGRAGVRRAQSASDAARRCASACGPRC